MRFLANENISGTAVRGLRGAGHDVLSVKESMRGADDADFLARAQTEGRVLLTHDKDFGELAYRRGLPARCGVVLFRLSGAQPDADNWRILSVLQGREDWAGAFSVVTEDRLRMRPLPKPH
ncbi:MAG: hypothetical protein GW893_14715 [Armatimonadetes bacterium]|nr:hypothetical protein [Armatimonadota bacterium]PIU63794.1 MAG: hypothetical protein COS85_14980 [Armatimonadetes bacterium CG07_land_8_20_14_0_80_59_28]